MTIKATVQSCFDGSNQCQYCSEGDTAWDRCSTSGYEFFTGDINSIIIISYIHLLNLFGSTANLMEIIKFDLKMTYVFDEGFF